MQRQDAVRHCPGVRPKPCAAAPPALSPGTAEDFGPNRNSKNLGQTPPKGSRGSAKPKITRAAKNQSQNRAQARYDRGSSHLIVPWQSRPSALSLPRLLTANIRLPRQIPRPLGNITMSAIVNWTGASGRKYEYHAWYVRSRPGDPEEEGNYIFAKIENGYWIPLYIGQGLLQRRYDAALQEGCVVSKGASHYHVHLENNRERRIQEEIDIIDAFPQCKRPTGCNNIGRR